MDPYLKGLKVIVSDGGIASTLINKGSFGTAVKGGGLSLDIVEAAYLVENDRIRVRNGRKGDLLRWEDMLEIGSGPDPASLFKYVVYRDLRSRGMVARQGADGNYLFYPRGTKGMKAKPSGWASVFQQDDAISPKDLLSRVIANDNMRIRTLYAIVDSDYDVTYYICRRSGLSTEARSEEGSFDEAASSLGRPDIRPVGSTGSIASGNGATDLGRRLSIGTEVKGSLLLSREEAMLLRELSGERQDDKDLRYSVFRDLTIKGHRVRSGLKYGCHFRVYSGRSPKEHSAYLVQCMGSDAEASWEWLSRAIRLCHSVRKRMILAFRTGPVSDENGLSPIQYLEISWHRP
ncbi:MAG: tRNA-intron lyase [Candidatus Thermoplasmatota archaeon]|nr:tRNA-intron lyase [Candidatus Thermoplasmatota archaeon]